MADINIQEDLNAVNGQITKMVEELNKISVARDQLLQQVQNMNGVAMYLRGKLPPEEQFVEEAVEEAPTTEKKKGKKSEEGDNISRSVEYP